jgi:para-aminobenzoate synthetase/4-amino-4-deoxychorismate lyase
MKHLPEVFFGSSLGWKPDICCFDGFAYEVAAYEPEAVVPALENIASAVREGMHAAGFVSYEAASALDSSLSTRKAADFPLLWFGVYKRRSSVSPLEKFESFRHYSYELSKWQPSMTSEEYRRAVERIRDYIAAGDIYQVNFTLREECLFTGDVRALFLDLCRSQPTHYSAFIDLDRYSILSTSPELFFQLKNGVLTVRPMKGTARRGTGTAEDAEIVAQLQRNEKERAENLMIVDLLRNDLGRVSENGSVTVNSLFDVETFETVHQMTSTISSRLREDVGLVDLFRALFPCGSITGAPKKRSMEIIAEMEDSPRGLYTGCIGFISPGMRHAAFSVAIRTVVIDKEAGTGELGVGSGITWYSAADAEFDECLAKGLFAQNIPPEFALLESLLFEEDTGYFLLERHLERLSNSAIYFRVSFDLDSVRSALEKSSQSITGSSKVRLILSRTGSVSIEIEPLCGEYNAAGSCIAFADTRVASGDPFLYHKTSNRELYRRELERRHDCLDVIFLNERGEVTEGANNNIVIRKDGLLLTPTQTSGLLPGTFRAQLLETRVIEERVITRSDVELADEIYLINSVRKWRRVRLVDGVAS